MAVSSSQMTLSFFAISAKSENLLDTGKKNYYSENFTLCDFNLFLLFLVSMVQPHKDLVFFWVLESLFNMKREVLSLKRVC
jgi:hypothetical protein